MKYSTVVLIVALTVGLLILAAGSYLFLKIESVSKENSLLKDEINTRAQQEEMATNEEKFTDESIDVSTSADVLQKPADTPKETEVVERTVTKKEIVYVPQKPLKENEEVVVAVPPAPPVVKEEVTTAPVEPINPITVSSVRQTAYPDGYGGVYGSYEIELSVNPGGGGDILIPQSTTNSIGTGEIGISYSVVGRDFEGDQSSKYSCPIRSGSYCKFNDDGKARTMVVTIFLTPGEEINGNYGVLFESIAYIQNDEDKVFNANRKTANINIFY